MSNDRPTVLSLFSGVGGFDYGLEQAGMRSVYQCEIDKHARSVLDRHWPDVPKWGDITTLTADEILRHAPQIDVVAWGSPCQDLSVAGKRAGLDGAKSSLFYEGMRVISELRKATNNVYPRISIWENVAGALSSNKGDDFGAVIDSMAEQGALVIEWAVLDAQGFGIPQRRRRVFVIAIFDSAIAERCTEEVLPVGESVRRDTKKSRSQGQSATSETATGTTQHSAWWNGDDIAATLTSNSDNQRMPDKDNAQIILQYPDVVGTLTVSDLVKRTNNNIIDAGLLQVVESYTLSSFAGYEDGVGTLRAQGGDVGGGSETLIPIVFENSYRDSVRVASDDVSPTLTAKMGTGGNNTPMVAISYDGMNQALSTDGIHHTLRIGKDSSDFIAVVPETIPIDMRNATRDADKHDEMNRQGVGIGSNGDVSPTITAAFIPAVAHDDQPMLSFDTQFGSNANVTENISPTLKASQQPPSVAYSIREDAQADNFSATEVDTVRSLSAHQPSVQSHHAQTFIAEPMAVRRLLPIECERLMGWGDDWTRYRGDGTEQADSHRYRQIGNGVASPVARWVAEQILRLI